MATFKELQDEVKVNVIDLPPAVTAAVPSLVNRAVRKIQQRYNFKCMEAYLATTTDVTNSPANLLEATLPATFKAFRMGPLELPTTGLAQPMAFVGTKAEALKVYGDGEGRPKALLDGGLESDGTHKLYVYPSPDGNSLAGDGEYTIHVPYYAYLTVLSADADTNWFTQYADTWIIYYASSLGFLKDWDNNAAQVWATMAKGEYDEVVAADKQMRMSSTPTWTITANARV